MTAGKEPAGSPVTAVRRMSRGPSAGFVLVAVASAVIGAIIVAVASGPGPAPVTTATLPAAEVPASPAPLPTAGTLPPSAPTLQTGSTVVVLRGLGDPANVLGALTGCPALQRVSGQLSPGVQGADVDTVAEAAGRETGWIFVPPGIQAATRVWLGNDIVGLAQAAGEQVVAVGEDGAIWLGGAAGATRWRPVTTPAGRTAWVMTADQVVGSGSCGAWTVPSAIEGQRSLTCAGIEVSSCLSLLAMVRAQVPELLLEGRDLVVAVPPCIDSHRCFATPAAFVSVPASWSGNVQELRAAVPVAATGALARIASAGLPDYALEAIAHPALPLPRGGEKAKGNDCGQALVGELRTSPWDPRVAWVGTQAVVWPTATTIQFLRLTVLIVPGVPFASYGATAITGDRVLLIGSFDRTQQRFDACAMRLLPSIDAPAATPGPQDGRGTGS